MGPQHAELRAVLARVRARWRAANALGAWRTAASIATLVLIAAYAMARIVQATPEWALASWLVGAAGAAWAIARAVRIARRDVTDAQVARFVEEHCPELEDTLATATAIEDRGISSAVSGAVIADATRRASTLDLDRALSRAAVRRSAWRAAAATLSLVIVCGVTVAPLTLAAGQLMETLFPRPLGPQAPAPAVAEQRPPRVERIDLHYEYPAAFGMAPRVEEDGGDIYGPAGTRVHLEIHVDRSASSGALTLAEGFPVPLRSRGDLLEGELTIDRDGSYRIALADAEGRRNSGDTEYFIRTLDDRPPDVRIVRPATDRRVTSLEEVSIAARADDDFGIDALELVYAVRGGAEKVVPLAITDDGTAVEGVTTVFVEDLGVQPGDFIAYYARARDVSRGKRSTEARSDMFFLQVSPFEEEFVASQGQGGGGSGNQSVDELVDSQKEVISATWRLDRRGRDAGASSAEDIQVVARAQGDLRNRALAAAAQMQRNADVRRRRPGEPRPTGRPPAQASEQAMAAAAEAMGAAQQQLDRLQTGSALPHEMRALNDLLRAQADVRRREVQQQQSGGGSGQAANRQQQDLSSLFDRELARQQRTNYETPRATTEARQSGADPDLERVRELARRQEALNREQRALASSVQSEEERRRSLERLTRDQNELRQQAEELARRLGASRPQQAGARAGLEGASQDMRAAASELRRQDPEQASERGERALEGLRRIERGMQGGQSQEAGEPLAELSQEAGRIAEAQRKLVEQGADGQGGRSQPDGPQERAAEQNRLADRTQRLEERVRDLARDGEHGQGTTLRDTARELERQGLSDRMREAARAGATPAGEPLEIARQLDGIAARLERAAAGSPETRALGEQLGRVREMREQLAEIDREEGGQAAQDSMRELLESLRREGGLGLTPAEMRELNPGRSAPGTETWKQDSARWEVLKVQVAAALQKAEIAIAERLRGRQATDRLTTGAAQPVPEQYRRLVEQYYRSLGATRSSGQ